MSVEPRPAAPARSAHVAELQAHGEQDAQGEFTLAHEQGWRKFQRFGLANPARYVLELVQAAVLKGARRIELMIDSAALDLRCDGAPFTRAELGQLPEALFLRTSEPAAEARRHLALALCTAMATEPIGLRVDSGDAQGIAFCELRPAEPDVIGERPTDPRRQLGTHIQIRWRRQLLKRILSRQPAKRPEVALVRERCCHAAVAITLNGESITDAPVLPESRQPQPFRYQEICGVLGVLPWPDRPAKAGHLPTQELPPTQVLLIRNGVLVDTVQPAELLPGFAALADCPRLRQDISHEYVVQDEQLQRVGRVLLGAQMSRLAAECARALERLATFSDRTINGLRGLLFTLLRQLGNPALLLPSTATPPQQSEPPFLPHPLLDLEPLLAFPILQNTELAWVSLGELLADIARHGSLAFSALTTSEPDPHRPLIIWLQEPQEVKELAALLSCPAVDRSHHLVQAQRQRYGVAFTLESGPYLGRAAITTAPFRGEVGVALPPEESQRWARQPPPFSQAPGRLVLLRQGALLAERKIVSPVPGLTLLIDGDFQRTAAGEVAGDAMLAAALSAAFVALVPLMSQITGLELNPTREPVRTRVLRGLLLLAMSDATQRRVRLACGVTPGADAGESPLDTNWTALWGAVGQWPLWPQIGATELVSFGQLSTFGRRFGCVPVLVLPAAEPRACPPALPRSEAELCGAHYRESDWQTAHARAPQQARSARRPSLVLGIAHAERELVEVLKGYLSSRYADFADWLAVLREKAATDPAGYAAPPRPQVAPAEVPPPEMPLVTAVRAELAELGQRDGRLLREVQLARLVLVTSPQPEAVLAQPEQRLIQLNLSHPLVAYAAAHIHTEPALRFFVASAIYTALTRGRGDATVRDGAVFCQILSHRALAALTADGAAPPT